ncbi:amidohydrolase [Bacillus changyiensis]|uniref:amidohydrolase n=1 Tax=Bacillus changyiensis TaxID=3004103 RepID=UPI0022DF4731|nr:amidohydrolase [Bacillus changyiensis]MDA1474987.1 amidohydrolase [Bacillus changyiensis]
MMNVIELRRDFHRHPEVGFTEFRTASKIVGILQSLGYQVLYGDDAMEADVRFGVPSEQVLKDTYENAVNDLDEQAGLSRMKGGITAIVGILQGHVEGPTVAYRFDIDALPVPESDEIDHAPAQLHFRSHHQGVMHACGHDGHTAIGLAFAENMADKNFAGTLKLIFQPAEEGGRGAYAMVKKEVVDDVDRLFCFHLGMGLPSGEISAGVVDFLASTKLKAFFKGIPSHAGCAPEQGRHALVGAATALLNIQALPRYSTAATRINVGTLHGGNSVNIIPAYAEMELETRSTSLEVNEELEQRVRKIIEHSAMMHDLEYGIEVIGKTTIAHCDSDMMTLVEEEAESMADIKHVRKYHSFGAGEDATFFMNRVQKMGGQATYMVIGSSLKAPHHHEKFDLDEEVLPVAVQLLTRLAKRTLQ